MRGSFKETLSEGFPQRDLIRGVPSKRPYMRGSFKETLSEGFPLLKGSSLVVFYYLSTSEIWPDKRDDLYFGGKNLKRDYCIVISIYLIYMYMQLLKNATFLFCMNVQDQISFFSICLFGEKINILYQSFPTQSHYTIYNFLNPIWIM